MSEPPADTFRWQTFFQHSTQPLFLLNRRRRVLFVNRAWEQCTGLTLAEVRGRVCRRRSVPPQDSDDALLSARAPPADAARGRPCQVRRRAPGRVDWWEVRFFPLAGGEAPLGYLGAIAVHPAQSEAAFALPEKLMAVRDVQAARHRLDDLDRPAPVLQRLYRQARHASQSSAPLTLVGEAGAGKQWLARAIHLAGERRQRFFACLDAERVSGDLLGAVLFGPRGKALGLGTVYLREPGHLPREWQARLAEVLLAGEDADFPRLIVGYRVDPLAQVRAGRLLEDLARAAATLTIPVPPLRERLDELPALVEVFLERERSLTAHAVQGASAEVMGLLRGHSWPENLRELQEVVRGACRRAKKDHVELGDVPFHLKGAPAPAERRLPLDTILDEVENRLVRLAMKLTQGNQTRAAELLEIWRPRLVRRLEKLGGG